MDEVISVVSGVVNPIKESAYSFSLICLVMNLFTDILPDKLLIYASWFMIVVFAYEIVSTIIKTLSSVFEDEMNVLSWIAIIIKVITIITGLVLLFNKDNILKVLDSTASVNFLAWLATCMTFSTFIAQVLSIVPDMIASFVDADF